MEVLTGHYLMNLNGPLDIIKSPVAHKQTLPLCLSVSVSVSLSLCLSLPPCQTATVAVMHTQCNVRRQLSCSGVWQPHKTVIETPRTPYHCSSG